MEVVKAPNVEFTCTSCGAVNRGQPEEFDPLPTIPPTWRARCAFCRCFSTCSPSALLACQIGFVVMRKW